MKDWLNRALRYFGWADRSQGAPGADTVIAMYASDLGLIPGRGRERRGLSGPARRFDDAGFRPGPLTIAHAWAVPQGWSTEGDARRYYEISQAEHTATVKAEARIGRAALHVRDAYERDYAPRHWRGIAPDSPAFVDDAAKLALNDMGREFDEMKGIY